MHPNATGIDIGDTFHAVAIPEGRDEHRVRTFGAMTCDLLAIAKWLKQCKIDTIAMESTGVYWKPLFGVLVKKALKFISSIQRRCAMSQAARTTKMMQCGYKSYTVVGC